MRNAARGNVLIFLDSVEVAIVARVINGFSANVSDFVRVSVYRRLADHESTSAGVDLQGDHDARHKWFSQPVS